MTVKDALHVLVDQLDEKAAGKLLGYARWPQRPEDRLSHDERAPIEASDGDHAWRVRDARGGPIAVSRPTAIIERKGDGFVAISPEVDVASQGDTVKKPRASLQDALELFLETASAAQIGEPLHGAGAGPGEGHLGAEVQFDGEMHGPSA